MINDFRLMINEYMLPINDYQRLCTIINDQRLSINDGKTALIESVILAIGLTVNCLSLHSVMQIK